MSGPILPGQAWRYRTDLSVHVTLRPCRARRDGLNRHGWLVLSLLSSRVWESWSLGTAACWERLA